MADHAHAAACLAASMVVWKSSANPTARLLPSDVLTATGVGLTRLEALYPFRFVGPKGNLGGSDRYPRTNVQVSGIFSRSPVGCPRQPRRTRRTSRGLSRE